jgi:hypothetical protein
MKLPQFSLRYIFIVVTICAGVAWACSAVKVHDEADIRTNHVPGGVSELRLDFDRYPSGSEVAMRFALWAPVALALYFWSRWCAAQMGRI